MRLKHEEEPDLRTNRESCLEVKGKANTYLRSRIAIFFFFFTLYLNSSGKWEHSGCAYLLWSWLVVSLWADITANSNEKTRPLVSSADYLILLISFLSSQYHERW